MGEVKADLVHAISDHDQDLHGWSNGDKFTVVVTASRSIDVSSQPKEKQRRSPVAKCASKEEDKDIIPKMTGEQE